VREKSDIRLETSYQGINQEKTIGIILDRTRGEKHVVDIYIRKERKKRKEKE
jgi:hypothetical protein